MGVDGGEYSLCRKRGVGFRGHVCRAGFLCETALGDFRVRDAIKNGMRQSRAPLRALARTRALAERPVSLDDQITDCLPRRSGVRRQVDKLAAARQGPWLMSDLNPARHLLATPKHTAKAG